MAIVFLCQNCAEKLSADDSAAGTKAKCPKCRKRNKVPVPRASQIVRPKFQEPKPVDPDIVILQKADDPDELILERAEDEMELTIADEVRPAWESHTGSRSPERRQPEKRHRKIGVPEDYTEGPWYSPFNHKFRPTPYDSLWQVFGKLGLYAAIIVLISWVGCDSFNERRVAAGTSLWPRVEGTVVDIEDSGKILGFHIQDDIWIYYDYTVDDKEYRNGRITYAELGSDSDDAKALVDRYPIGARVPVYYHPDDPQDAVLETGASIDNYGVLIVMMVFIAAGVLGSFACIWELRQRQLSGSFAATDDGVYREKTSRHTWVVLGSVFSSVTVMCVVAAILSSVNTFLFVALQCGLVAGVSWLFAWLRSR